MAFGDSLTAGHGVNRDESYPADLQRDLDARGYRYRVINLGISGNTTKDGVLRIPEVLQYHPSVVIVAFGGNDGLRGLPIRDTETNLFAIISAMQDAHAKVILGGITLPPNYGSDYIAKFNAIYVKESKAVQRSPASLHVEGCLWRPWLHARRRHSSHRARMQAGSKEFPSAAIADAS